MQASHAQKDIQNFSNTPKAKATWFNWCRVHFREEIYEVLIYSALNKVSYFLLPNSTIVLLWFPRPQLKGNVLGKVKQHNTGGKRASPCWMIREKPRDRRASEPGVSLLPLSLEMLEPSRMQAPQRQGFSLCIAVFPAPSIGSGMEQVLKYLLNEWEIMITGHGLDAGSTVVHSEASPQLEKKLLKHTSLGTRHTLSWTVKTSSRKTSLPKAVFPPGQWPTQTFHFCAC